MTQMCPRLAKQQNTSPVKYSITLWLPIIARYGCRNHERFTVKFTTIIHHEIICHVRIGVTPSKTTVYAEFWVRVVGCELFWSRFARIPMEAVILVWWSCYQEKHTDKDLEVFLLETAHFRFLSIILGAFLFFRTVLKLSQVSEGKL